MVASGITSNSVLYAAAASVAVRIKDCRAINARGTRYRFTLTLDDSRRWQRRSHTGRRVHAVCWHGHRAFFRRLFELAPTAVVQSSARLNGVNVRYTAESFERDHPDTGQTNIGSLFEPCAYVDACDWNTHLDADALGALAAVTPVPAPISRETTDSRRAV